MAVDPITEAENEMTEQAKWGLRRSDMALVRLIPAIKQAIARLKALEDRVSRLEGK